MTPDWREIFDLNTINLLWTIPWVIGTVAVGVHTVWTWQRWRATMSPEWIAATPEGKRASQTAAFWFFRQDAINTLCGAAMTTTGVMAIVRLGEYAIWPLLVGGFAFTINKIWNLYDDARMQSLIVNARRFREATERVGRIR